MPAAKWTLLVSAVLAAGALLATGMAVLVLRGPDEAGAGVATCQPGEDWPAHDGVQAAALLALVNDYRASLMPPAPPLEVEAALQASAEWKARHLAEYYDFDAPPNQRYNGGPLSGDDPAPPVDQTWHERFSACGYSGADGIAQNYAIAYASAQSVFNAWLGSAPNRESIENPDFTEVGVGAAEDEDGSFAWVLALGDPGDPETPTATHTPTPTATVVTETVTPTSTATTTETPAATASATQTPSPTATATPEDNPLFEGWNQLPPWDGPAVSGVAAVIGHLDEAVTPPVWLAVAWFDQAGDRWLATYRDAPVKSFNTLTALLPGNVYWLFVSGDATFRFGP